MRKDIEDLLSVWKQVFRNWRYSLLAILIMAIFYTSNVFINNFSSIASFYNYVGFFGAAKIFVTLVIGFKKTILLNSFISLIMITMLLGFLFSLVIYKTLMLKSVSGSRIGFLGTAGIFLGVLAPGCAACGIGLISLLGLSAAAISFLPYDGLELSVLAIAILGFSIFKISKDMSKGISCKIPKPKNKHL
ncbi:hypothetical protein HYT24_02720 [Candidatus Pacearchaeota archaeon]|nr:hypothetical protein [Candidatus Pacearchaeota archaeon]